MSALALFPGAVGQDRPQILYATVSARQPLPASFDDPLYVIEPHRPTNYVEVLHWVAHALPTAGAPVTVFRDNLGNLIGLVWAQSF
jgi:hypothetical protein